MNPFYLNEMSVNQTEINIQYETPCTYSANIQMEIKFKNKLESCK